MRGEFEIAETINSEGRIERRKSRTFMGIPYSLQRTSQLGNCFMAKWSGTHGAGLIEKRAGCLIE
jgi:hypothetical protein